MLNELFITSVLIAVISVVYIKILSHEEVLNWWFRFGLKFEKKWFWRPIWGCHLCFSGQVALWTYVFNWIFAKTNGKGVFWDVVFLFLPKYEFGTFSVFWLVFSITLTISTSFFFGKIYDFFEQKIK